MLPPTQGYIGPWRYRQHICPKHWQFTDLPSKTAPSEVRKKFLQIREKWRILVNFAKNFRLCKMPEISWLVEKNINFSRWTQFRVYGYVLIATETFSLEMKRKTYPLIEWVQCVKWVDNAVSKVKQICRIYCLYKSADWNFTGYNVTLCLGQSTSAWRTNDSLSTAYNATHVLYTSIQRTLTPTRHGLQFLPSALFVWVGH